MAFWREGSLESLPLTTLGLESYYDNLSFIPETF